MEDSLDKRSQHFSHWFTAPVGKPFIISYSSYSYRYKIKSHHLLQIWKKTCTHLPFWSRFAWIWLAVTGWEDRNSKHVLVTMHSKDGLGWNLGLLMFSFHSASLQLFAEYEKLPLICKTIFEMIVGFRFIKESFLKLIHCEEWKCCQDSV